MRGLFVIGAALLVAGAAHAQSMDGARPIPEIRPFVGSYLPTGDQSDLLKSAVLAGGQVGVELADVVHLIGTFAWTPTETKLGLIDNDLNLFQYDGGLELFHTRALGESWLLRPFAGVGLGGRTYSPKNSDLESTTYFAGYGALGAELQMARVAVRLEGRDYVSSFKGLSGEDDSSTRNDVMLALGVSFHLW